MKLNLCMYFSTSIQGWYTASEHLWMRCQDIHNVFLDCLVATWCFIAQLLTTRSFVLDVNGPLQGTTHRSHLAGAAVAVAVRSAHRVGRLRAGLGALAHRLVVLDHAHRAVIARLIQAGARYAEIWRANTEDTESKVRLSWGGGGYWTG